MQGKWGGKIEGGAKRKDIEGKRGGSEEGSKKIAVSA
jgi:hypothetical protein